MAEVIITGEPLSDVIVLAPRGSVGNSKILLILVEGREVAIAFTELMNAVRFTVALAKKGIDMRWCHPFIMKSLPIETGVWLDPSPGVVGELSVLDFIHRDN